MIQGLHKIWCSGQSPVLSTLYNLVQSGCSLHQISGSYDGKYQEKKILWDVMSQTTQHHVTQDLIGCNVFPSILLMITYIFRNFL